MFTQPTPAPSGPSRRELLAATAIATAVASNASALIAQPADKPASNTVDLHWLEAPPTAAVPGITWTVPWPRGTVPAITTFRVETAGAAVPAQSWPLAYWPDGSAKWTAFATTPGVKPPAGYQVSVGTPADPTAKIAITESPASVLINTGLMKCTLNRTGRKLIEQIERDGKPVLTAGELVMLRADSPDPIGRFCETFSSVIQSLTVEQSGPLRAVVKLEGVHQISQSAPGAGAGPKRGRTMFPFTVRLYFYAGSDRLRIMHSFIYDADETKDFLAGLGVRFDVPLRDAPHDRHIRFVGSGPGLFAEGVRNLTGLRRDPGAAVRSAQVAGIVTPAMAPNVARELQYIPAWGDYTLSQLSADGFQIRKRTKSGCGWVPCGTGPRAAGVGYIGGVSGGVAFGIRDFWQRHPTQLDVRNAHTDAAQVTLWLYSPEAQPLDMRFYHDGMGMDNYAKQNMGLDITYEDYEPGYGTPHGIARTSELNLWALPATPSRPALIEFADAVRTPPQMMCEPARFLACNVFGGIWTLPDSSTPVKAAIESMLTNVVESYIREVEQRHWYGFWDHGDVMHSYDPDRHTWKYDVGGCAWDNSELSPDLFFWYMVLRTARPDFYRFAESHVRHTGEVDVYHAGRFKGLGSRHNVQHWGCSSKQTRISTSIYRRQFYYLTGDERIGDLLRAQLNEGETFKKIVIGRKIAATNSTPSLPLPSEDNPPMGGKISPGAMGWGNIMSAWLTEAERTNDPKLHDKIRLSLKTIATLPKGLYTEGWQLDLDTGEVTHGAKTGVGVSHLTACFGLPEISAELIYTYPTEGAEYAKTWAQYGIVFNGSNAERAAALGRKGFSLNDSHSRATAFAAWLNKDDKLAARAWREYFGADSPTQRNIRIRDARPLKGPDVLNPIQEVPLGTNGAQFWLASLQNLHYIGDACPKELAGD